MNQSSEEARLVLSFAQAYTTARNGLLNGSLTPSQHVQLIDSMGGVFRDYMMLQQAGVAAQMAIERAKFAAPSQSN